MENRYSTKQELSISPDYYWILKFKQAKPPFKQFRSQSQVNISLACLPAGIPDRVQCSYTFGSKETAYLIYL